MKQLTSLKQMLMGNVKKGAQEYTDSLMQNAETNNVSQAMLAETQKAAIAFELKKVNPDIDDIIFHMLNMNMQGTEATFFIIHHEDFKRNPKIQYVTMRRLLEMEAFGHPLRYDNNQRTPLMEAASVGNAQLVSLLLEAGAEINHKDKNGDTALIIAARADNLAVFKILHEYGAREDIANNYGATAWTVPHPLIDHARKQGAFDKPFVAEEANGSHNDSFYGSQVLDQQIHTATRAKI